MTNIMLGGLAFMAAASCVGAMGFAIQRGATCTVAAVEEVLEQGSFQRLASLAEASLWVTAGLLLAQGLRLLPSMPPGYALSGWTVAGAALLGLGAFVNRSCVFGTIAKLGSGQWAYAATPLGFYAGCLGVGRLGALRPHDALPSGSPVLQAPLWVAGLLLGLLAWRLARSLHRSVRDASAAPVWSPHLATTVIGITFVLTLMLAGAWAYTDVLAELARGMAHSVVARVLLLLALLIGSIVGGWTAGRLRPARIGVAPLLRCFVGGLLMGAGSLLIPGSNDGLILVGMPLLWPYAWTAFAVMCVSIAVAHLASTRRAEFSHFDHGRSGGGKRS